MREDRTSVHIVLNHTKQLHNKLLEWHVLV